jgi:hypothetical protein
MSVYNYTTLDFRFPIANGGTSAYGINNAGEIVGSATVIQGGLSPSTQKYGFIYNPQDGTYTSLNDPFSALFRSSDIT